MMRSGTAVRLALAALVVQAAVAYRALGGAPLCARGRRDAVLCSAPLCVRARRAAPRRSALRATASGGARPKVGIVGAGNVGGTAAFLLALKGRADVVLVDIAAGLAQGKALDIAQSRALYASASSVAGSSDIAALAGADVVVVTSGLARKPGMSRDDLVAANAQVIADVAAGIRAHAPDAIVVVVTNPLDVMTYHFLQVSAFDKRRVIGMAGLLDSCRLQHFIAEAVGCRPADVGAMVLGGHGDDMLPLLSCATVNGLPVSEFLGADELQAIATRTANGGAEIVGLLQTGSAFYAPAASVVETVEAVLGDAKRLLPCRSLLAVAMGHVCMRVSVCSSACAGALMCLWRGGCGGGRGSWVGGLDGSVGVWGCGSSACCSRVRWGLMTCAWEFQSSSVPAVSTHA